MDINPFAVNNNNNNNNNNLCKLPIYKKTLEEFTLITIWDN
jgi:hypothetical protein